MLLLYCQCCCLWCQNTSLILSLRCHSPVSWNTAVACASLHLLHSGLGMPSNFMSILPETITASQSTFLLPVRAGSNYLPIPMYRQLDLLSHQRQMLPLYCEQLVLDGSFVPVLLTLCSGQVGMDYDRVPWQQMPRLRSHNGQRLVRSRDYATSGLIVTGFFFASDFRIFNWQ